MIDRTSLFFKRSQKFAESFIQSVVIVDDDITFEETSIVKSLTPPTRSRQQLDEEKNEAGDEYVEVNDLTHRFYAKPVIDKFAERSIVCSVFSPNKNENSLVRTIDHLANCADVIVLDWSLYKDNGEKVLSIFKRILDPQYAQAPQLRLFVVYTAARDISDISRRITEAIQGVVKGEVMEDRETLTIEYGPTRIVVLAKPETRIPDHLASQAVSFKELADRVTEEFAVMTTGLVSNFVLASLSSVRRNTFKVLSRFCSNLDAPYLTHRALLTEPREAEALLIALVSEELRAVLEESYTYQESAVSIDSIRDWIQAQTQSQGDFELNLPDLTIFNQEQVISILENGLSTVIQNIDGLSNKKKKKLERRPHREDFTKGFALGDPEFSNLDEKFAFVTSMRSYYGHTPRLTLGSIIKHQIEATYWLCMQPRCDSTRINRDRPFAFLPLDKVDGNLATYHFQR